MRIEKFFTGAHAASGIAFIIAAVWLAVAGAALATVAIMATVGTLVCLVAFTMHEHYNAQARRPRLVPLELH